MAEGDGASVTKGGMSPTSAPQERLYTAGLEVGRFPIGNRFVAADFDQIDEICEELDRDSYLLTAVRHALPERYKKLTSIILERDWPSRYCYHEETDDYDPHYGEYERIVEARCAPQFQDCMSVWQWLDDMGQDKLYLILCSARMIFHRIIFDVDDQAWILRPTRVKTSDALSHITYYGKELGDGIRPHVFETLARRRSVADIQKTIKCLKRSYMGYQRIEDNWQLGLTAGMTNGLSRVAVFGLLDHIAGLIAHLPHDREMFPYGLPKIAILNETSTRAQNASSATSDSLPATTRSSDGGPKAKRRKSAPPLDVSSKSRKEANAKKLTFPNKMKRYCDLNVVCMDSTSGVAKYLLMVEILSLGKNPYFALAKFTSELIHALQSQNMVFGVLFSKIDVKLMTVFKTERSQHIYWNERNYSLVEGHHGNQFAVKNFQLLIMDILSCLVYGMENIQA